MIGKTISHYKIIEKLGEGSMGKVYKAKDTKLKRIVALKFLPHHLIAGKTVKQRFFHEARAASALNHPNIITIHDIHEEDGEVFIVMECVDGELLSDKLKDGPLKQKELIDISSGIAEGLNAAHNADITHRDIKSDNIIISKDGTAKILDFGLAKQKGMSQITQDGTTLGTQSYMSPEQVQSSKIDQRSDIFSFGVVMYQMATGKLPFEGEHDAAILYSIVNEAPIPTTTLNPNIDEDLQRIISKALEKDVKDRYQHADDIMVDLRKIKNESYSEFLSEEKKEKSILVLPFVNMSSDPEQEYFSDGLTEEVITDLSHIHELLVISRNSAMTFKGTKKKIKEIAKEVNVQYVLEGSVRKAGNNLRITAQLIDAASDAHLWAEKYAGTLDDVFDIQEKVSRRIVDALKIKLSSEEKQKITTRQFENVDAYECYLRARYEIYRWTEEGLDNALKHLQYGLEIDGKNAVITAGLGYVYYQYINMGLKVEDELYLQKAQEHARHALELESETPLGHIVLGIIEITWGRNIQEGIKHLKKALTVSPNDFDATYWLIALYAHLGKTDAANSYLERLKISDPLNPWSQFFPGFIHMEEGQFALSLKLYKKISELYPYIPPFRWFYALNLAYLNRIDEAYSYFKGIAKEQPNAKFYRLGSLLALALKVKKQEVKAFLNDGELEAWAKNDFSYSYYVAESYALIDEKEKALDWLEIAINRGLINYPFINEYDPLLENIRNEERFKILMKRVKHEWENFEI